MKETTDPSGVFFGEDGRVVPGLEPGALNEELAAIDDGDLEVWIVEMKQHMDGLHAKWLTGIAEYDRRQIADIRHRLTTTAWLRSALKLTGRAASGLVKAARGLHRMPNVRSRAITGEIGPDSIRLLDRARRRHPEEFDEHETVFAEVATYLDQSDLRTAIAHWEQQIDYPSAMHQTRAERARRRFSINQTWDGMWALTGELDPETGSIVDRAIREVADRSNLDPSDRRAPWQVRADALGHICDQSLRRSNTNTSSGIRPHIAVTVDADVLLRLRAGLGSIDDAAIPPETTERISCDSTIIRILVDAEKRPIDVGRATRTIPPALRRALDARDAGCQWSGCDARADWCDAHHIEHWADGGRTDLDNLVLLCRRHHTATHESAESLRSSRSHQAARAP